LKKIHKNGYRGKEDFWKNDIAVLKIKDTIEFGNDVKPIEIASGEDMFVGVEATLTGWGVYDRKDKDPNHDTMKSELQVQEFTIIDNDECKKRLDGADPDDKVTLYESSLCIVHPQSSACSGDSGGPLFIVKDGKRYQVGITSYGEELCTVDVPGVFTRVSKYHDFITKAMAH